MKTFPVIVPMLLMLALLTNSCSAHQWYEGHRASLRGDCLRLPGESEFQRCMEDAELPYENYQRRRDGTDTPRMRHR